MCSKPMRWSAIYGAVLVVCLIGRGAASIARADAAPRERLSMDAHWRFMLGDPADAAKADFDDAAWRQVDLPHDWSIEGKFDPKAPTGGAGGFLPTGVGWYRRSFVAPTDWRDRQVAVEFEGVYMNADVFLNGEHLASHPYGYTSFPVDLRGHLKIGQTNVLAVRVDNSQQPNTRWYSGSGIYRHVWIDVNGPLHLAGDVGRGVFFTTTQASTQKANVHAHTTVANDSTANSIITVQTALMSPDGEPAGQAEVGAEVKPGASITLDSDVAVSQPQLWSPQAPQLYIAITRVLAGGAVVDEEESPIGIRMLRWSAKDGIQINGQTVKLCGGCLHHDNGCLGSAAFDRAEERRVELLKAAGFNAVRTAHNPPSPAFLNACDRLGMLVLDESFDCWEQGKNRFDYSVDFDKWWQRDLDSMVMRDRNHPSVIIWSVGNEIPNHFSQPVEKLSKLLVARVHGLDPTRPVTAALNGGPPKPQPWSNSDAAFSCFDVAGYNYNLGRQKEDHARNPDRLMVATESFPHAAFEYWSYVHDNPYVLGDFVWTAMDYIGENGIGRWQYAAPGTKSSHGQNILWPWHGAVCGDIDSCGFRRYQSHYRNILWDRGEKLYMVVNQPVPPGKKLDVTGWGMPPAQASWTWPGQEGNPMHVQIFSRYDQVRLMLDEKMIGEKTIGESDHFTAEFTVPYAPGVLRVVALQDGKPIAEDHLETASAPVKLRMTPDRPAINADDEDLSFVQVEVADAHDRLCPNASNEIRFSLDGDGTLAGVGNADMSSVEPYQGDKRSAFQGRALVVVRAADHPGAIRLRAQSDGLSPADVLIQTNSVQPRPAMP
jgi:beta-galactosidase